ncbi:hypothetical protein RMN57_13110 [Kitasatospora sp. CM 4170]|uniref:Uncharacterized protein n=1 Tax=Kitasatospora aburaviensis TaxID=67265 RepID=A0ABW1F2X0_9ACTN|nr:hypothetical protein [Kitasatospora sp. CM 4170]WNM45593.1 hypothetical protein RMN57_13110 [Kitasatospora sp. CM 4170]
MLPALHLDRLRIQLAQLPELITLAHLALLPGSGRRGARVSGATRTAPLPCRVDVLSLVGPTAASTVRDDHGDQDQTPGLDLLAGWARTVLDDRQRANDWTGWVRPAGHDWERTASRAVKVLLLHLDWAATRQYARDLADEIGRLHGHLNRVSGTPFTTGPARRHVCARCKLMTATIRPDGMCECSAPDCLAVLTADEYADRAERVLAELAKVA